MEKELSFQEVLDLLTNQGKANDNIVYDKDLKQYYTEDSDEYDKLESGLEKNGIDVLPSPDEEEEIEEGPTALDAVEEVDITSYDVLPSSIKVDDPVRMYLKDIGKVDLLDIDQETKFANLVVQGRKAKEKKDEIDTNPELQANISADEVAELERQIAVAEFAKEKLINANLRLVVSIAKKYMNRGLPFLDLIQEGNMGLIKAVDKFDPDRGFKFSTYATWWIRQAITRAVADQARTIRIPVHMVETINKLVRVQRQLVQELSREATPEEVAERMGISVEKVQQIQRIALEPISLENPVGEEEDSCLGDFISDPHALDPYEYTEKIKLRKEIDEVLDTLTDREQKVIRLRFGIPKEGDPDYEGVEARPHTLEEVGKEFNVTRERIRQIEAKALRKLKHPSKSKKLKDFMGSN